MIILGRHAKLGNDPAGKRDLALWPRALRPDVAHRVRDQVLRPTRDESDGASGWRRASVVWRGGCHRRHRVHHDRWQKILVWFLVPSGCGVVALTRRAAS